MNLVLALALGLAGQFGSNVVLTPPVGGGAAAGGGGGGGGGTVLGSGASPELAIWSAGDTLTSSSGLTFTAALLNVTGKAKTTTGFCVDGDSDQCMDGDAAGGYVFTDETGATIFTITTAGVITTTGAMTIDSNGANTVAVQTLENTAGDIQIFRTDATPQSSVTGSVGDIAIDGTNGAVFLKTSGSATNTGWSLVWNAANDGAGSGLDADLLDGSSSAAFCILSGSCAIAGAATVGTTLGVTGASTLAAIGTSGTLTFNAVTTDIASGTDEDIAIDPNGTGDVTIGGEMIITAEASHASHALSVVGATLASTKNALSVTGTLPNVAATQKGADFDFATTGGAASTTVRGININLAAGSITSGTTTAVNIDNKVAGTGAAPIASSTGNFALAASAQGAGAGHTVGVLGEGKGSTARNMGLVGRVNTTTSTDAIAVLGQAAAGTIRTGGLFMINSAATDTLPIAANSGIIVSNGDVAADIVEFKDNTTLVWTIADGGVLASPTTSAASIATAAGTTSLPSYSWVGATDNGMWLNTTDTVSISTNAVERVRWTTTTMSNQGATGSFEMPYAAGAAATPTYSFAGDNNLGAFRITTDEYGISTAGVQRLSIDAADIVTAVPLSVVGGTLASTATSLSVTGTLPDTAATQSANNFTIATTAGTNPTLVRGMFVNMTANSTTAAGTRGLQVTTAVAGTATTPLANFNGNLSGVFTSDAVGGGHNVGLFARAQGSTSRNIGGAFLANTTTSTDAFGVIGMAAAGTIRTGGLFMINSVGTDTLPIAANSGIIVSNGDVAADIAEFKDNTSTVLTIADGGAVTSTSTVAATRFDSTSSQAAACAANVLALTPTATTVYVDANAATCAIAVAEPAASFLNDTITIVVFNLAAAGSPTTFTNNANVIDGPTLCATTGFNSTAGATGVYSLVYADLANDTLLGVSCTQNL